MTFKVERAHVGYEISTGEGQSFMGGNLEEVKLALDHYFSVIGRTWEEHFWGEVDDCPLCKQ